MQVPRWKKGKQPEDKTTDAASKRRASTLLGFLLIGIGGGALVLMLVFAAGLILLTEERESSVVQQVHTCSDKLARDLGNVVAALQQRLGGLTADPLIRDALRTNDLDMLRVKEESLARLIPGALRVRLVVSGHSGPDEGGAQALSYAGLDLVHQAEREREVTPLEMHRVGQEDMHMAAAAPVLDEQGGAVLGVMHVALPTSLLPSTRDAGGERARVLFQQLVGGAVAALDPERRAAPPVGEPDYRVDVPGTHLQAAAWISPVGIFDGGLPFLMLGAYVVVLALLGLVLWIPMQRARRALALDFAGIVAVVEDAVKGSRIREVQCRFAETEPVAAVVSKLLQDLKKVRQEGQTLASAPAAGQSAAASGEGEDPASAFFRQVDEDDEAWGGAGGVEVEELDALSAAEALEDDGLESIDAVLAEPEDSAALAQADDRVTEVEPLDLGEIDLDEILPLSSDEEGERESNPLVLDDEEQSSGPLAATTQRIFRAYDIRGIVGEDLTAELSRTIGLAVGSEAVESGESSVYIARDTRPSGEKLCESLADGLRKTGCNVTDLGIVPTPLLYFATRYRGETAGVMVTGSHNPLEYNGMKVVIGGESLVEKRIAELRKRLLRGDFASGSGSYTREDLVSTYVTRVRQDIAVARSMKVVVDCGNGAASAIAGELYRALDVEIVEIDCDPRAGFPDDRVPDPTREECMAALRLRVVEEEADIGFAFDGDGDRLGVVDSSGDIVWADRVLMLLAADVLTRHPGTDVVFDVKSSHHLAAEILRNGGRPVMWRSGHAPLKAKLAETGALLAGEWSGHIIFQERWNGFDDALYAGARLLEVLALDPRPSAEVFAELPFSVSTPELFLPMAEGKAQRIVATVGEVTDRVEGADLYRIDGLRVAFAEGWGLVRASNTQPALVFRFEGDDESALDKAKELLRTIMCRAAPDLDLPF